MTAPPAVESHAEISPEDELAGRLGSLNSLLSVGGTWAILLVWSFSRAWIPGINEPHYLCKAKHWWNPEWCAGDFFLTSSNPHLVFYVVFGWLTWFLSLEATAVVTRLVSLLVLAIGWWRLCLPLLPRWSGQALALSLFLVSQSLFNFSGEWLVGGVESKVPAYGFGFWGIGLVMVGAPLRAACLLGLATAFHPLVGGWLTLCLLGGWLWTQRREFVSIPAIWRALREHVCSPTGLKLFGCWLVCSLPGLWPAVAMLLEPASAWTRYAGDYLQVFYRLRHHLDPMEFAPWRYGVYALLGCGLWLCHWKARRVFSQAEHQLPWAWRLLIGVLLMSLLIAFVGVLLGWRSGPPAEMFGYRWRLKLLKFYPFRVFDLLMPIVLAICSTALLTRIRFPFSRAVSTEGPSTDHPIWWKRREAMLCCMTGLLLLGGIFAPQPPRSSSRMSPIQKSSWRMLCDWIRTETDPEALFITPREAWAFKWFAERAEFVNYKDCPQDAAGIVEWNRRLLTLREWHQNAYGNDESYSQADLTELAMLTGADYLIVAVNRGPFEVPPHLETPRYRLYKLPQD